MTPAQTQNITANIYFHSNQDTNISTSPEIIATGNKMIISNVSSMISPLSYLYSPICYNTSALSIRFLRSNHWGLLNGGKHG